MQNEYPQIWNVLQEKKFEVVGPAPPFDAYAVTCGITFTFGGVRIDTEARVIDVDGAPIPGLYACGEMAAGLFYFNYPGGSGLTAGAVFGHIAGHHAATPPN